MFSKLASVSKKIVPVMVSLSFVSCGGNFLKNVSVKVTAETLLEDAKLALDDSDYTTAITKLETMRVDYNASYLTCKTEDGVRQCPREILAGAYAGRCGMNFFTFISSLSSLGSGALFGSLMNAFTSIDVIPDDCWQAQSVIQSIPAADLTSDEKFFLAILGLAKIGTYLRSKADTDKNGTVDAAYSSCTNASSNGITDAELKQVITGLGLFITYSSSVSSSVSLSSLTVISAVCGPGCTKTDPSDSSLDTTTLDTFRDILRTSEYGVDAGCAAASLPTCCP